MLDDKEERIRSEAYRLWEKEGRPHGEHDRHWQEAVHALENGKASDIMESEGTTQAVKLSKAAKPKAVKADVKVAEVPVAAPKRSKGKKAAE